MIFGPSKHVHVGGAGRLADPRTGRDDHDRRSSARRRRSVRDPAGFDQQAPEALCAARAGRLR